MLRSLVGSEMCIRDRMYIASIRNAVRDRDSAKPQNNVEDEANELLAQANALRARCTTETKEHSEEILKETSWQFDRINFNDKEQTDELIAHALTTLYDPAEDKFGEVHDLYVKAIEKYQEVEGNACQPKIDEVTQTLKKSDKTPLHYRQELYDQLSQLQSAWKKNALLREGKYVVEVTDDDLASYIEVIKSYIETELPKCQNESDRIALIKTGHSMVEKKGGPGIEIAQDYYRQAKDLCDDNENKRIIDGLQADAEHTLTRYKQEVDDFVHERFSEIAKGQEQSQEDLLAMYHEFSLNCAKEIRELFPKGAAEVGPDEVERREGAAAYRLETLLEVVKQSYERDCALRKELHTGVDGLFDDEGLPL
eukprot:TRINITY_DN16379_c0_g1_i4.p1 TRINITY_DN16379_c0_g1~~TRINITY_DN16379_c0_g1_i4.p1  ORF type:complete len:412 (-),score=147.15 TRINITY_DN16379_c0_g1_i4:461-1561(-)